MIRMHVAPRHLIMPPKKTAQVSKLKQGRLQWIDIPYPNADILEMVKDEYGFHELDVEDCLSGNQRAKIDEYSDYLFMVVQVPSVNGNQSPKAHSVYFFIAKDLIVSVHKEPFPPLQQLWSRCEIDEGFKKNLMGKGSGFLLYEILDEAFAVVFPFLDHFEERMNRLETEVFALSHKYDRLKDILNLKKHLIHLHRLIAPQHMVVLQLEQKHRAFLPKNLHVYFGDVLDKIEKITSSLEGYKELIESLQATNESIISHATNRVIKTLTVFSVVTSSLTFFTGLYGMNVALPLAHHEGLFVILVSCMLTIAVLMLAFFKWRRWI